MTFIRISVPVYKKNCWDDLEKDGRVEVSSDVDNLSEGYQSLKLEIDKLLSELNAQDRLAKQAHDLENEIEQKARKLQYLLKNIEQATEHYESLRFFLHNMGIDPNSSRLTFDKRLLLQEASVAEVKLISESNF